MMHRLQFLLKEKLLFFLILLLGCTSIALAGFLVQTYLKPDTPAKIMAESYPELTFIKNSKFNTLGEATHYYQSIARKKGAAYAFALLAKSEMPPLTDFHLIAHALGQILYEQQGVKGITVCDNNFGNGCSHAIVINEFVKRGVSAVHTIAETCRNAPGGTVSYVMCFHGVGHGVLGYTNYDMPQALELCKKFKLYKTSDTEYRECIGGVVMEMIFGLHDNKLWSMRKEQYLGKNDPLYLCRNNGIPESVSDICYIYLTPYLYQYLNISMINPTDEEQQKVFSLCTGIPLTEKNNRLSCYYGFGKEFIPLANERDLRNLNKLTDEQLKKVYHLCTLARVRDGIDSCVKSAALASYWGGRFPDNPGRFCRVIDNGSVKKDCFTSINSFSRNSRLSFASPNQ